MDRWAAQVKCQPNFSLHSCFFKFWRSSPLFIMDQIHSSSAFEQINLVSIELLVARLASTYLIFILCLVFFVWSRLLLSCLSFCPRVLWCIFRLAVFVWFYQKQELSGSSPAWPSSVGVFVLIPQEEDSPVHHIWVASPTSKASHDTRSCQGLKDFQYVHLSGIDRKAAGIYTL